MSQPYYPAKPQAYYPGPDTRLSSRESYPTFLSVGESLQLQLQWAWCGLYDAFRWNVVFRTVTSDPEIRANVYKSFLLNSLSVVSIYTFELLLEPLVRNQERWLHRNIGWFYHVLWLLPVLGVSFYLNSTWCGIIAKRTYALNYGGRGAAAQPTGYAGMLKALATSAYRIVMVFTSLLVSFGLGIIPYVGPFAGFVFFCWIDAYYCFEFIWISRGMSLARRVRHLEERWAYYLAFGLPATAICMLGRGLASAALFALVYPAYIILAMHSNPRPHDPYNPLPPSTNAPDTIRHPSPFIPIRVPVFALVIWLNDNIVRILSVGGGRPAGSSSTGGGVPGRSRAFSDAAESVEEGEAHELGKIGKDAPPSLPTKSTRQRVTLSRRKVD
ncbi:hypothetical protein CC1G_13973 [Coprinopsis cinerea okayama7|uniref:Uncharacterized protein n=1 Tax=Coprinopsis cinerea (strain Okayama-7 / 130 / ATCC MYA-4618 / FGSC 9003) TaxID=240176 RepID=D6RKR2_COPC7|nr:hypothetical protein CC1G_13973 [Coprinopsis cinerea okayama7\|eukprot:XP_002911934.1 hypothetical protein CC1G_13973 [Coprinopsis cinerea okayama7\